MALAGVYNNPQASAFLLDPSVYDILEGIAKNHGLPIERSEEFLDLTEAVMDEVISLSQMPSLLAEAFGIEDSAAQKLAADIAGQRLLPFEYYLPGLKEQILAWGGKLEDYPSLRIQKEQVSALDFAKRLLALAKLDLSENLQHRLAFLLDEFLSGKKDQAWVKDFLFRSVKVGGLGLEITAGDTLLGQIILQREQVEIIDPDAIHPKAAMAANEPEPASVPAPEDTIPVQEPASTRELEISLSHELAAEVPVVSAPKPEPVPEPVVKAPPMATRVAPVQAGPATPDIDAHELKVPAKKAAMARKIAANAEDSFATALVVATEQAAAVLKKAKISEKVFADLAGKAIRGLRDIYQTRDIVERDWKLKGEDLVVLMQAIAQGVERYEATSKGDDPLKSPLGQGGNAKAAVNGEGDELDKRFSKLTVGSEGKAIEPARAQLTVGSTALTTPDGQRKMVDVVSSARLAGPIEQLGKMTPTEFRRLSSSAAEAGQKIEDLLAALESTAYEERVKGVLAWRDSPMNQLYLKIAEEALSQGLALPEVSSRRRAAGQESLSPAEIKALALLNTRIRF